MILGGGGSDDLAHSGWGLINATDAMNYINLPYYQVLHGTQCNQIPSTVATNLDFSVHPNYTWYSLKDNYTYHNAECHKVERTYQFDFPSNWEPVKHWAIKIDGIKNNAFYNNMAPYAEVNPNIIESNTSGGMTRVKYSLITYYYKLADGSNIIYVPYGNENNMNVGMSLMIRNLDYVDVRELSQFGEFKLFPNPSSLLLTASYQLNYDPAFVYYEIYNVNGEVILKGDLSNLKTSSININIEGLSKGIYLCKFVTDKKIFTEKFIKL